MFLNECVTSLLTRKVQWNFWPGQKTVVQIRSTDFSIVLSTNTKFWLQCIEFAFLTFGFCTFLIIRALILLYQINADRWTHVLLGHHSVNTIHLSNMFQPLKGHLQGVHLIHPCCTCVLCTVAAICCGT